IFCPFCRYLSSLLCNKRVKLADRRSCGLLSVLVFLLGYPPLLELVWRHRRNVATTLWTARITILVSGYCIFNRLEPIHNLGFVRKFGIRVYLIDNNDRKAL